MRHDRWLEASDLWELARSPQTQSRDARLDTLSIAQQALCLSKERARLRLDEAFARAVTVLKMGGVNASTDQETLGIAGGIYKRYWDTFRQQEHLHQAFSCYDRGWRTGGIADNGYTAINAAYVADVLAYLEETIARRGGASSTIAEQRRRDAQECRRAIVAEADTLEARAVRPSSREPADHPWWILVTLAEAHFGLARDDDAHYTSAESYVRRALALPDVADWMVATTARQLGALARMREATEPAVAGTEARPWKVLNALVDQVPGLRTEIGGKVGLALSGGGLRASLFHIGVLARLAELDMLRHVEVMSCVSGGSILGAVYYLRLRDLLESKRDDEIAQDDYIKIVHGLEGDFLRTFRRTTFACECSSGSPRTLPC